MGTGRHLPCSTLHDLDQWNKSNAVRKPASSAGAAQLGMRCRIWTRREALRLASTRAELIKAWVWTYTNYSGPNAEVIVWPTKVSGRGTGESKTPAEESHYQSARMVITMRVSSQLGKPVRVLLFPPAVHQLQ